LAVVAWFCIYPLILSVLKKRMLLSNRRAPTQSVRWVCAVIDPLLVRVDPTLMQQRVGRRGGASFFPKRKPDKADLI